MGAPLYIIPLAKLTSDFGILGPLRSGNVMVEYDIHLRLVPTSKLDIHKVFEILVCCLIEIWQNPYIVPLARLAKDLRD
jgi:hypothetical protein